MAIAILGLFYAKKLAGTANAKNGKTVPAMGQTLLRHSAGALPDG